MKTSTKKKLEAAGWRVGDAQEFLGLTDAEEHIVQMKLALARILRRARETHQLTQEELAKRVRSSQSRVAKMEAGDVSISLDLLMKTVFAAGAKNSDVAKAVTSPRRILAKSA
ncbi:MAG TPA: helix-turn-helix transcriptional regulator [Thermoanaerobaculia bacterium]|nr:helix-turn-helix transcriptional regulator [Thermoanaerobaculia bacterium]